MDEQRDFRSMQPGKYRRAFDWRLSDVSGAARDRDLTALSRVAKMELLAVLEDLLEISRKRRKNWTSLAKLQLWSLQEVMVQEASVKYWRQRIAELEKEGAGQSESRSADINKAKKEQFMYRLYANTLRVIGDGIAWRALDYDRAVTRLMSERQTKQYLSSEGTFQELMEWSYHYESGNGLPILNALTNCLAIGDVTVVRNNGAVEIIEVKSSKAHSPRIVRQKHAMKEVVTVLDAGAGHTQGKDVQIEILSITPETGLDIVRDLITESTTKGYAAQKVSNCLYVEAYDYLNIDDMESVNRVADQQRESSIGEWHSRGDDIVSMNTLDWLAFTPNVAPFSVFPFDSRTCIELAIGARFYITYLNCNAVAREFEHRGWKVKKSTRQLADEGTRRPCSWFGRTVSMLTFRPPTSAACKWRLFDRKP
jgi:hypothetical protein